MKLFYLIFAILVLFSAIVTAEESEVSPSAGSSSSPFVKQGVGFAIMAIALYFGTWTYVPLREDSDVDIDTPMAIGYAAIKIAVIAFTLHWTNANLMFIITWFNLELFFAVTRLTLLTYYLPVNYVPYRHFFVVTQRGRLQHDQEVSGSPFKRCKSSGVGAFQTELHSPYFVSDHLASWVFFSIAFHALAMIGLDYLDRNQSDFVITFSTFSYTLIDEGESNWDMQEVKNTFKTSAFVTFCVGTISALLLKCIAPTEFGKRITH